MDTKVEINEKWKISKGSGPMYHKQNKMFVDYLSSLNPEAFKKLVLAVQRGDAFPPCLFSIFHKFLSLKKDKSDGTE